MFNSLSQYVAFLESKGELIRIDHFVDPLLEIAEVTDRVSKSEGGGKALLFTNTGTPFPVLTNMMGSSKRVEYALGIESFEQLSNYMDSFVEILTKDHSTFTDKLKLLPTFKEASKWLPKKYRGRAPVQEVVMSEPDLSQLPILKCWPEDGGRFITLPLVHTTDPQRGVRNVGMYRMQVFSNSSTAMHWHRHKTGARHFNSFEGERFPIAVALGGDPVFTYAATAPLPDGIDEYLLAGFIRKKPVELVRCLTQPIDVPANCDFIIEGYIDKVDPLLWEGPFGDHTGFYSPPDWYPKFTVTCITHRKDAIYPATLVGVPPQEDKFIAEATEKIFLTPIKFALVPEILDLYLPEEGCGHNFAVVKITKSYPGQAIKVANALWGAGQMMFNKILLVVDGDIDIRARKSLLEAISQNYYPPSDSHFSRGPSDILDHAAPTLGYGGKVMIDATNKLPEELDNLSNREKLKGALPLHFYREGEEPKGKISVLVDQEFDSEYLTLWLWGANCDPVRDFQLKDERVLFDATSKEKQEGVREWPPIAHSSLETIESVDKKWSKLNLGEIIGSPSIKFFK